MIEFIKIQGLGVIDEAEIELDPGLTVLTGETGAGKTMVLTGLGLLAGDRADPASVRHGSGNAAVEGVWSLDTQRWEQAASALRGRLDEVGASIDLDVGSTAEIMRLVVARSVADAGRSRAVLGGRTVPVAMLQEVAASLVTVHGQAQQHDLRLASRQRELLDRFAGEAHLGLLATYQDMFRQWRAAREAVADLLSRRSSLEERARQLALGIEEIESVDPQPGEDVELDIAAARLSHAGALFADARLARVALVGDDDELEPTSAMASLERAHKALERVHALDPSLADVRERLQEVTSLVADLSYELSAYADGLEADPARQQWVEQRRAALRGLLRRYGASIDEVLAWLADARATVVAASRVDDNLEELRRREADLLVQVMASAERITQSRCAAAKAFAAGVTAELGALAMPDARLEVEVTTRSDPATFTATGADDVEFQLVPHSGALPRPVSRGASGGELSRVMLAIEVVLAGNDPVPTFVFDEVDAGIGGRAAVEVGRRLARLARSAQVLVVTHLPQVAAFADRHVVITKAADGSVTSSSVQRVADEDRVTELVRMLSGLEASEAGAAHARELLDVAEAERASWR
ncbi:MAG: DNA repair protein RecN [Actinomycetales bacterium]